MISKQYEEAGREALASCPSDEVHLHTLEIAFPGTLPRGVEFVENWTFTETGTINWKGGNPTGTYGGSPSSTTRHYTLAELRSGDTPEPRWSLIKNNPLGLRFDFEDDSNCSVGQTEEFEIWNNNNQVARAEAKIRIRTEEFRRLLIKWEGIGESEDPGFERMTFSYRKGDSGSFTEVGRAEAAGGSLGCEGGMVPVVSSPDPPQFVDLDLNDVYTLRIDTQTGDPLYHNGAFYQFIMAFFPTDAENEELLNPPPFAEGVLPLPSIYIIDARQSYDLPLEQDGDSVTFEACPFRFELPGQNDRGLQEMRLQVDNINRRVADFFEMVKDFPSPVVIRYRWYLESDQTKPQNAPPLELELGDISVNSFTVSGRASFADIVNLPFLTENYTRRRFPTLGVS